MYPIHPKLFPSSIVRDEEIHVNELKIYETKNLLFPNWNQSKSIFNTLMSSMVR